MKRSWEYAQKKKNKKIYGPFGALHLITAHSVEWRQAASVKAALREKWGV